MIKDKQVTKKVYIYEIEPVTFLNFSMELQSNILNLYNEFLREFNHDFQIYISNQKMNVDKYISTLEKVVNSNQNFQSKEYIESIKKDIESEKIYITKYYIVISMDREQCENIEQIDNVISKLDYIGCHTKRIKLKKELCKILYEGINKEVLI